MGVKWVIHNQFKDINVISAITTKKNKLCNDVSSSIFCSHFDFQSFKSKTLSLSLSNTQTNMCTSAPCATVINEEIFNTRHYMHVWIVCVEKLTGRGIRSGKGSLVKSRSSYAMDQLKQEIFQISFNHVTTEKWHWKKTVMAKNIETVTQNKNCKYKGSNPWLGGSQPCALIFWATSPAYISGVP